MGVGEQIRIFRLLNGMTQEELAEKMGYKSKASINKIEKEVNSMPVEKVKKFADVLNTSPSVLLGEESSVHYVLSQQVSSFREDQEKRMGAYYYRVIDILKSINEDGQKKILQYAEDIQDKYRKDSDATEEA